MRNAAGTGRLATTSSERHVAETGELGMSPELVFTDKNIL
jgi:hypothetical protein